MPGIPVFRAMQIIVLANYNQKEELIGKGMKDEPDVIFINHPEHLQAYKQADAIIDLQFDNSAGRIELLKTFLPATVIINSVEYCLGETDPAFVRINGWNSFLSSDLIEASSGEDGRAAAENIFSFFHKQVEWLEDQPGFVTPRVVSMIINEAFLALEEGVSSRQDIDTAMKLGTNYPYGPFEWAGKIGTREVYSLLVRLSRQNPRYNPASLLEIEAAQSAR